MKANTVQHQPAEKPSLPMTLRAVAAWLECHPQIKRPFISYGAGAGIVVRIPGLDRDEMAALARSVGGRFAKDGDDDWFWMTREIVPGATLELTGSRERVCERIVVGTEEVMVPDPDAPMVAKTVEKVEWRCEPLLAGGGA